MSCAQYLPNEVIGVKDTEEKAEAAAEVPCVEFACSSVPVPDFLMKASGKMRAHA